MRAAIVETAKRGLESVRSQRREDRELLKKAAADSGLREIAPGQIAEALEAHRRHVDAVVKLLPGVGPYTTSAGYPVPPKDGTKYPDWFRRQVIGHMKDAEPIIASEVGKIRSPADRLAAVLAIAGDDPKPDRIKPYEAKIILFYLLPEAKRRELTGSLKIRFDIRDILPANSPKLKVCAASPYDCTIMTDSYVYGALRNSAMSLQKGELLDNAYGTGADCSSFVQQAFEGGGIPASAFHSPISTELMLLGRMPGYKQGLLSIKPVRHEKDLLPGDAIVWDGHTQLFIGYDESLEPRVIEEVGDRRRTAVESRARFTDSGQGCGTPTQVFARMRAEKLPL
jgi:hypothetical protein